jgi:hypothetical protein
MTKSTAVGDYTIDHEGLDGRWRAVWVRPDGYLGCREFHSRRQAVAWAENMTALETEGRQILEARR